MRLKTSYDGDGEGNFVLLERQEMSARQIWYEIGDCLGVVLMMGRAFMSFAWMKDRG